MDTAWAAVSGFSAAVSAIIVIAATFYAYLQVREARRARTAQILLQFQQWYLAEPYRTARRRLFDGEFQDLKSLNQAGRSALEDIVDQFEYLGMLVSLGLLDEKIVVTFYRYSPSRVWKLASAFIEDMRDTAPGYGAYFAALVGSVEAAGRSSVPPAPPSRPVRSGSAQESAPAPAPPTAVTPSSSRSTQT